jgi:hypothetical protein
MAFIIGFLIVGGIAGIMLLLGETWQNAEFTKKGILKFIGGVALMGFIVYLYATQ